MNKTLKEFSGELVSKLMNSTLTIGDLRSYLDFTNSNLKEVSSLKTIEEIKNAATPFLVMLSNSNFTNNNYLWQTICARGYYISSYYIQIRILDKFNTPKPEELLNYIELLKTRLLILSNGESHFPELIFKVPNNPNLRFWTPLSGRGTTDKNGYKDIALSDAGLISKYASSPLFLPLQQETLSFANSVLSENSILIRQSSIEEIINKGLAMNSMFFNYLHLLMDQNNELDFHTDDDSE